MERVARTVRRMDAALGEFEKMRTEAERLDAYLGSDEWKADCEADRLGILPPALKRGVLSEDGIWNVLEDWRRVDQSIVHNPQQEET